MELKSAKCGGMLLIYVSLALISCCILSKFNSELFSPFIFMFISICFVSLLAVTCSLGVVEII